MNRRNFTAAVLAGILLAGVLSFFGTAMAVGPPESFFETDAASIGLAEGTPDGVVQVESVIAAFSFGVLHGTSRPATLIEKEAVMSYLVYDSRHNQPLSHSGNLYFVCFMNDGTASAGQGKHDNRTMSKEVRHHGGSRTA